VSSWPTFEDVLSAYKRCQLNKPANRSQTAFEKHLGENILRLHVDIHNRKYKPRAARVFAVLDPKPREIFAADFRDRVVHHLVVHRLEPRWERKFIHASFASRKGKGVHSAIKYLRKKMRSLNQGGIKDVYALQVDISSFFVTINRQILSDMICKSEVDPTLIYLIQATYLHDARKNAICL
jgi:RNA-directed DNA polymerase